VFNSIYLEKKTAVSFMAAHRTDGA